MPISVSELLELPHLALEVVAGEGGMSTPIRWAHVSEVEDPTPWLEGGELMLTTGLGLPLDAPGQRGYVERLARARAAGVVIVADSAPAFTREMHAAADELDFPLISTLLKQPFQAISKIVFAANSSIEVERIVGHLRIYGILRTAAAQGASPADVLSRLSTLTGLRLATVREDGRPQFEPGPAHPRWSEAEVALGTLGPGATRGLYARLEGDGDRAPAYVIQVEAAAPTRVFLIAEGVTPTAVPDLIALHHIATIVATQVLSQRAERAARRKVGSDLLSELVENSVAGQNARDRVRALGVPPSSMFALVVRPSSSSALPLADTLHDVLLDHDLPALVGVRREHIVLLVAARERLDAVAEQVVVLLRDVLGECTVGVGTPGDPLHASTSYREALTAAAQASKDGVVHYRSLESLLAWLPAEAESRDLLVERTVGPLLAYDAEHRSDLVRTLREYLGANRASARAAATLHVHRNTLAYRLRKIEHLTGRSLASFEDVAELWLGLRSLEAARSRVWT